MDTKIFKERFDEAAKGLNNKLFETVIKLPESIKTTAQEIRLRAYRPLAINCNTATYYIQPDGKATTQLNGNDKLIVTQQDIIETFQNLCCYSVYSRQNEIRNGFITMTGGHRAGICGTAVYSQNYISNIRDISSINIRVARQIYGCAGNVLNSVTDYSKGFLICGAPSSGKTTILRDLSRSLSNGDYKVSVIDERGEIAGSSNGICQNDLGQCDILDGYQKKDGFFHAIRSLSPQIIVCDELGGAEDISCVKDGLNAGVAVIGTIHASSAEELIKRENVLSLLKTGAFEKIVFLKARTSPGQINYIRNVEDMLNAKNYRSNSFSNIKWYSGANRLCKAKN